MKKEKIKLGYDSLWEYIIRPPKYNYKEDALGAPSFVYRGKIYNRKDYNLMSSMGYIMKCSYIEPDITNRTKDEMPLVLYLHGNASSRIEGIHMIEELLKRDINIFLFDFPGCGLSEGDYISLGFHEKDDVGIIIDFIENIPGVGNIGIWGRSMGAATSLLYAHKDPRVKAICFDSPFADFKKLAKEISMNHFNFPNFLKSAKGESKQTAFILGSLYEYNKEVAAPIDLPHIPILPTPGIVSIKSIIILTSFFS